MNPFAWAHRGLLLITLVAAGICPIAAQTQPSLSFEPSTTLLEQRTTWAFDQWPRQFIDRALCLCLLAGYPDSVARDIRRRDRYYPDPVAVTFFDSTLEVLLITEIQAIRDEAEQTWHRLPEGRAGRPNIAGLCLEFYRSERLQRALHTTGLRWEQVTDILAEIQRVISTY